MGQRAAIVIASSLALRAGILAFGVLGADRDARAEGHTAYLAAVADLPLMPGLAELTEAGLVFDQPSGRIIEAYAQGAVSRAAVRSFYLDTLPNLGWRAKAEALFQRGDEELRLDISGDDGALVVRFTLQPR
jgi:hypothetical protein